MRKNGAIRALRPARRAPLAIAATVSLALTLSAPASALTLHPMSAEAIPPTSVSAIKPAAAASTPLRVADPAAYAAAKHRAESRYRSFEGRRTAATGTSAQHPTTAVFGGLNQPGIDAFEQFATPPDPTGAIGPNDYLEMVNSEIGRYSRSGLAPVESAPENVFVGSLDGTCDGQIQWDQQGQRWLYAALDCEAEAGHQALFFGWSKTPSASLEPGNWCHYQLPTGHRLEDYPKLGHDNTQVLIGTNTFEDEGGYVDSRIWIAPKPAPGVTPACSSITLHYAETLAFTPVPANVANNSAHGYVVAEGGSSHLVLFEAGESSGSPTLTAKSVAVPEFETPAEVPQPGTPEVLDSSDTRLTQSVATTDPATGLEGIWTEHTVAGPGGGPSVVRWYELSPGASTPRQIGTVAGPGGTFAFNAAISPTTDGNNAAVIYNAGDQSHLVSLRAQNRHATTALGAMEEEVELGTSVGADEDLSCTLTSEEICRWGDYAGASPDPANPGLVWGTGELTTFLPGGLGEPQWGSRNFALDVSPPPPPPPAPTPPPPGPVVHRRVHCRKGFKKRHVHGKTKCVKVKKHHHHHHHHHHH